MDFATTNRIELTALGVPTRLTRLWRRLSCAAFGHHVDNHAFRTQGRARSCRCGAPYLRADGSLTRVRHTLSCFLGRHTYTALIDRDGCREYVCVQCGHPLLFANGQDPYRGRARFEKKVRYLCGLFGHRVRLVAKRDGWREFACHCGHSFLKGGGQNRIIRHPLVCVVLGHFIHYVTTRGGHDEFVCVNCGHPFCFARATIRAADVTYTPRSA
jgi:hypothetical protein